MTWRAMCSNPCTLRLLHILVILVRQFAAVTHVQRHVGATVPPVPHPPQPFPRGLHSSTYQRNLSIFLWDTLGTFSRCMGCDSSQTGHKIVHWPNWFRSTSVFLWDTSGTFSIIRRHKLDIKRLSDQTGFG